MENIKPDNAVPLCGYDHVELPASAQIGLHSQQVWELSCVVRGHGLRTLGTQTERFMPDDMVIVPPGLPHCWTFDEPSDGADGNVENFTATFDDAFLARLSAAFPELRQSIDALRSADMALMLRGKTATDALTILRRMEKEEGAVRALSLSQIIVIACTASDNRRVGSPLSRRDTADQRIEKIDIFLRCNYLRPITLTDIAAHVGMNRNSLCVFFHRHTGKTVIARLNEIRISQAKYLLRTTQRNVGEVCFASGFNDISHFCHTFRKVCGQSPLTYRKAAVEE